MNDTAPIILFVYNRPQHTKRTIDALKSNHLSKDSDLYIYSDGHKNDVDLDLVGEVRRYIGSITGFRKIIVVERNRNYGLANSIIDGVSSVINKYGKAIILEDDLITSPYFLTYMNDCLDFYNKEKTVCTVSGFVYDLKKPKYYQYETFLFGRSASWGWGTWSDKWNEIEFSLDKIQNSYSDAMINNYLKSGGQDLYQMFMSQRDSKIDSWAIRLAFHQLANHLYTVYPVKSYVSNIGYDTGTHADSNLEHKVTLNNSPVTRFSKNACEEYSRIFHRYLKFHFIKARIWSVVARIKKYLNIGKTRF